MTSPKHSPTTDETVISCEGVWKIYGKNPEKFLATYGDTLSPQALRDAGYIAAVRDVTLDIYRGEILVIMGLSGSGKSSFVRCLSRLVTLTKGRIMIHGQDIAQMSDQQLIEMRRSSMGMVFQNFALLPHRSVLENVAFPLEMRGQNVHERMERAREMVKLVGLEGREEYFPRELSGGQQQRVGIARSLAIEPEIWFLDEPFSALDPLIRKEMQNEFLRLQEILGITIIFITHDFDEALRLADRIAIMKDGVVEQIGTPDGIVLQPATDYVQKFTEDIHKAQVVHLHTLANNDAAAIAALGKNSANPLDGNATLASVARQLVDDVRPQIPIADAHHNIIGALSRSDALELLLANKVQ